MVTDITQIDFAQIKRVLSGVDYGRRVGNTTARIMQMIAHGTKDYGATSLLFVGENHAHVKEVQMTTFLLIDQIGFVLQDMQSSRVDNRVHSWYNNKPVTFTFVSVEALPNAVRGIRFHQAFIDVQADRQHQYREHLDYVRACTIR